MSGPETNLAFAEVIAMVEEYRELYDNDDPDDSSDERHKLAGYIVDYLVWRVGPAFLRILREERCK